jgi:hypothetical protein
MLRTRLPGATMLQWQEKPSFCIVQEGLSNDGDVPRIGGVEFVG